MAGKLMYNLNDNIQNYPFYRKYYWLKILDTQLHEPTIKFDKEQIAAKLCQK